MDLDMSSDQVENTETEKKYFLDDESLSKVVEALLIKVKASIPPVIEDNDFDSEEDWNLFLTNFLCNVDTDYDDNAVSVETLKKIFKDAKVSNLVAVEGTDIESAVDLPLDNALYILTDSKTQTNKLYGYVEDEWIEIKSSNNETPEFEVVDTTSNDSVNNIVAHVNKSNTSLEGSTNVQPDQLVTAQALLNTLIDLAYARVISIPYSESKGRKINEIYPKPNVNSVYLYQMKDKDSWALYTVTASVNNNNTSYTWVQMGVTNNITVNSGATGSETVSSDLKNYWSKDELVPITEDEIINIVNTVAEKVGF